MSKKLLFAAIASVLTLNAFADSKTITTQGYVDTQLETKQNTIETDMVDFNNGVADLPAIVTYDSTDGVTGNKIGILDYQTVFDDEGSLNLYSYSGGYGSEMDNYVPTVRAVAEEVQNIRGSIPSVTPLTWNSTTDTAAVNNYSTTFNGTTNNWPTAQSTQYVRGAVLANALALKQNKIPAGNQKIYGRTVPSVVTNGANGGAVGQMGVLTSNVYENLSEQEGLGLSDISSDNNTLTTKALEDVLFNYFEIPTENSATGVVWKNIPVFGQFSNGRLSGFSSGLAVASSLGTNTPDTAIPNAKAVKAAVETKQDKMTCTRWLDNAEHTDANCLLWNLN